MVEGKHQRYAIGAGREVDTRRHFVLVFQYQVAIAKARDRLSLLVPDADRKQQQVCVNTHDLVFISLLGERRAGRDKKTDQ